jgi:hypothetical protein
MRAPAEPVTIRDDPDPHALSTSWRGHVVRVQCAIVPRYFFTTADITVEVDGAVVLHSGGQKKATGTVREHFGDHDVTLSWGHSDRAGFPVTVTIDGDPIFVDEPVTVKNRSLLAIPMLAMIAIPIGVVLLASLLAR